MEEEEQHAREETLRAHAQKALQAAEVGTQGTGANRNSRCMTKPVQRKSGEERAGIQNPKANGKRMTQKPRTGKKVEGFPSWRAPTDPCTTPASIGTGQLLMALHENQASLTYGASTTRLQAILRLSPSSKAPQCVPLLCRPGSKA
eukprot:scaffold60666_cov18-Tisochrysis_lutea.AAC.1